MSPCLPFACHESTSEESPTCQIIPCPHFPHIGFGAGKALEALNKNRSRDQHTATDLGNAGRVLCSAAAFLQRLTHAQAQLAPHWHSQTLQQDPPKAASISVPKGLAFSGPVCAKHPSTNTIPRPRIRLILGES